MSKFGGQDWLLVLHEHQGSTGLFESIVSKRTITTSATYYAQSKKIPMARRFSSRKADTNFDPFLCSFNALSGNCLSGITSKDKLFIIAHASDSGIAWMADGQEQADLGKNALALARLLRYHGLQEVGLITFKACYVGRANFLITFAHALFTVGINAGWLKGYKGLSQTEMRDGKPREVIRTDDKKKLRDHNAVRANEVVETDRYKIVRGPGSLLKDVNVGRYDGAQKLVPKGRVAIDVALQLEEQMRTKRYALEFEDAVDD